MAERYLNHPPVFDEQRLAEWENIVRQREAIKRFCAVKITRKTFFKRMAALGYQNAEALEMARSWKDE